MHSEAPNQKQLKKKNARIMKWRQMMDKGLFADKSLLLRRARKGIPPSLRIKVWPELFPLKKIMQRKPMTYSKILYKDSLDVYDINLDIPRTFSFESEQVLRKSLFNILKALSIQFPEVGYCQGMNFLAMRLLQVLNDELTFYLIAYILKKYKSAYDNFRNPGYVNRQNSVFKKLLKNFLPKIYDKLQKDGIQPVMYTTSWFLTLYSKSLSPQKFYRFFDCFLVQGYVTMYRAALALLKLKEKTILDHNMEENLLFVSQMSFYDAVTSDTLIQTMCSFEVDEKQVIKLEKQYSYNHRNSVTKIQSSIQQNYIKKKTESRLVTQWTMDQFNKTKASFVSFSDDQR